MKKIAPVILLLLTLGACLENEEEITVHEDGSVTVRITAEGDARDLTTGYAVPLQAPWEAADDETRRWIETLGASTGDARARARFDEGVWVSLGGKRDRARLEVTARFDSARDIPQWFGFDDPSLQAAENLRRRIDPHVTINPVIEVGPDGGMEISLRPDLEIDDTILDPIRTAWGTAGLEPYRNAFLRRSATVEILERGGKRVYLFERVFHGRTHPGWRGWTPIVDALPEEVREHFEVAGTETLRTAAGIVAEGMAALCGELVRQALGAIYIAGDASLSLDALARILGDVRAASDVVAGEEQIFALLRSMQAEKSGDRSDQLEADWRDGLRAALALGLEREGVTAEVANAVRAHLEWSFAAFDHTDDLQDERFALTVNLPGRVLSGNYHAVEGGRAEWHFEGKDLKGQDRVLRAVSVLE